MATTTDQVVTEFIANDRITDVLERIAQDAAKIGNGMDQMQKHFDKMEKSERQFKMLEKAIDGVGSAVKSLGSLVVGAFAFDKITDGIGAAINKIGEFGKAAITESGKVERLTATFAALSAPSQIAAMKFDSQADTPIQAGGHKMDYLRKLAPVALGQFDDLAEAATKLEASGLLMEHWMPMVSNLAGAFGASKEKIDGIADALGKIASGSPGEGLERLRDFAITRSSLEEKGIKFDKGGQLLSSVEDTLAAIEQVANEKFGDISKYMSGTFEQRFSNIGDAWNNLLDNVGKAWLPVIGKLLDSAQTFISFLSDSGWISDLSEKVAGVFDSVTGNGKVPDWVFTVMAALEDLPDLMRRTWEFAQKIGEALSNGFVVAYNFAGKLFTDVINTFQNGLIMATDRINETISNMIKTLASVDWVGLLTSKPAKIVRDIAANAILPGSSYLIDTLDKSNPTKNALDTIDKFMTGGAEHKPMQTFTPIKDPSEIFGRVFGDSAFGKWWDKTQGRAGMLQKQFGAYQASGGNGLPESPSDMFNGSFIQKMDKTEGVLKEIAKNTKDTADKKPVDLKDFLFGGGSIARNGISLLDVSGSRVPGPSMHQARIEVRTSPARDSLERAMTEIVTDLLGQLSRAGLLGAGGVN